MKTKLLMICLMGILTASCNNTPDGIYIIYSTEVPSRYMSGGIDFSISNAVAQREKGKRYQMTFTEQYVTMKPLDGGKEILLNRTDRLWKANPNDTVYHTGVTIGGRMTDMHLTAHTTQVEPTASLTLVSYSNPNDSTGNSGPVFCQLTKVKPKN